MTAYDILFVQGAGEGAHPWDQPMVDNFRAALPGENIAYPVLQGLETVDWPLAKRELLDALGGLKDGGSIVAHSLGGAAVLKLLSEVKVAKKIAALFLIAVPYKAVDGEFGTDNFALTVDFAKSLSDVPVTFYHSRDDDFVDFANLARYREKLPGARFREVDGHKHQFLGVFPELADDVRGV